MKEKDEDEFVGEWTVRSRRPVFFVWVHVIL
jgi:hypothetical protein